MLDNSVDSAWPHQKGHKPNGPLLVYFAWGGKENDDFWIGHMKLALTRIHGKALSQNCIVDNAPVYCNTTLADDTSVGKFYSRQSEQPVCAENEIRSRQCHGADW